MAAKDTVTRILITAKDEASSVFTSFQRHAGKIAIAVAGYFGVRLFGDSVKQAEALDVQMRKLEATIEATGGAAGLTAQDIDAMARRLDEATLGSAEGFRKAAGELLTFKSVGGDAFETTLELAQDLADAGFGSLESNAKQLGRALEDPIYGMQQLRRAGVMFSADQQQTIKSLVETGRAAEAQGAILDAVSGQVGGVARAAGTGLSGALDLVKKRFTDIKEQLGSAVLPVFQQFYERLAELYKRLTESGAVATFGEAIAAAMQAAQDAFFRFFESFDIDALIEGLKSWATTTKETVEAWAGYLSTASDVAKTAFGAITTGVHTIRTAFYGVAGVVADFAANATSAFASIMDGLSRFSGRFRGAADEARAISDAFAESARINYAKAADAMDDAAGSAERTRGAVQALVGGVEEIAPAVRTAGDAMTQFQRASRESEQAFQNTAAAAEDQAEAMAALKEEYRQAVARGDLQRAVELQQQIRDSLAETSDEADKAGGELDKTGEGAQSLGDGMDHAAQQTEHAGAAMVNTGDIAKAMAQAWDAAKAGIAQYSEAARAAVDETYANATGFQDFIDRINGLSSVAGHFVQQDDLGAMRMQIDELQSSAAVATEQAEELERAAQFKGMGWREFDNAIAAMYRFEGALAEARARVLDLDHQVVEFHESVRAGTMGLREQEQQLTRLVEQAELLGSQDLAGLRNALDDVRRQMQDLADASRDTLMSIQDEIDQLDGRYEAIERRRMEQRRAQMQDQLAEAQEGGNAEAAQNLIRALAALDRLEKARLEDARSRERQDRDRPGTRTGSSATAQPTAGGGLSAGAQVVVNIERGRSHTIGVASDRDAQELVATLHELQQRAV